MDCYDKLDKIKQENHIKCLTYVCGYAFICKGISTVTTNNFSIMAAMKILLIALLGITMSQAGEITDLVEDCGK